MVWYYVRDGARQGPVEEAEFNRLIAESVIRPETLVWREGMPDWRTLRDAAQPPPSAPAPSYVAPEPVVVAAPEPVPVAAEPVASESPVFEPRVADTPIMATATPSAAAPAPAAIVQPHYCSECGKPYPSEELVRFGNASICAACKPIYAQRLRETGHVAGTRVYAGFWIRFLAFFIDAIALWIVNFAITSITGTRFAMSNPRDLSFVLSTMGLSFAISAALSLAYHSFFLVHFGATPGKMALKLKVITPDGGGISWGRAIGRYFAQFLSGLTMMIGYIMAGFDSEKRALHDYIAGTRVIRTSV